MDHIPVARQHAQFASELGDRVKLLRLLSDRPGRDLFGRVPIIGGLVSYPLTALGAVLVGLLESFAAFESSALKDVIVFAGLIPVLIWRSALTRETEDDVEE